MSTPFHKILGINKDANKSDIKKAYRAKAFEVHPDVNNSPEAQVLFIELAEAYEALISGDHNFNETKKSTTSKKYWDVYMPPTNDEEYEAWKKVDDERRVYFKQKAKEEAIKSKQTFEREVKSFRKSKWFYPIYSLYFIVIIIFFLSVVSSVLVPFYVKMNPDEYNFSDTTILYVGICTTTVSFFLFYYLKELKKDIDPYFYGS